MRWEDKRKKEVNGKVNLLYALNYTTEVFYDIPGWPGYRISPKKNVWSVKANKIMKQYQTHRGHPQKHVVLTDEWGRPSNQNVQKLFWKTFYKPRFLAKNLVHNSGNLYKK